MTLRARADARPPHATSHDRPRVAASFFEELYERSADPWSFASSDYERRKYAHTLSSLGARRYGRALEIGCSIGVFTELLASVTEELVAIDVSERALARARQRLDGRWDVRFARASFPEELPAGPWDLIVCSEILYYLDGGAFAVAVDRLRGCLEAGSTLLAVHWRAPTRTYPLLGDEVHGRLIATLGDWHVLDDRRPQYRLDRFEGR
jgi:SAM-dependent methyltransferase